MQVDDLEMERNNIELELLPLEAIEIEQTLLQREKIEIDFSPVLFIRKSMETYEGSH